MKILRNHYDIELQPLDENKNKWKMIRINGAKSGKEAHNKDQIPFSKQTNRNDSPNKKLAQTFTTLERPKPIPQANNGVHKQNNHLPTISSQKRPQKIKLPSSQPKILSKEIPEQVISKKKYNPKGMIKSKNIEKEGLNGISDQEFRKQSLPHIEVISKINSRILRMKKKSIRNFLFSQPTFQIS